MRHFCLISLSALFVFGSGAIAEAVTDFEASVGGWRCVSDDGQIREPTLVAVGGDPGGFIQQSDFGGGSWFFEAPSDFRNAFGYGFGGSIAFSLRSTGSGGPSPEVDDLILEGPEGRLVIDIPTQANPGSSWTRFSFGLGPDEKWVYTGPLQGEPREAQIRGVLDQVTRFRIRGDWRVGSDSGSLDTVAISPKRCGAADIAEPFGLLDLADTLAFVEAFVSGLPDADIDGNGLFDLADITAFVASFLTGCL
jgi:hypothetical protein